MRDEFVRVYYNGICVVAEFRRDYFLFSSEGHNQPTFVLAESAVRERIENRKKYGLPTSEEIAALSAIERLTNGEAPDNAG